MSSQWYQHSRALKAIFSSSLEAVEAGVPIKEYFQLLLVDLESVSSDSMDGALISFLESYLGCRPSAVPLLTQEFPIPPAVDASVVRLAVEVLLSSDSVYTPSLHLILDIISLGVSLRDVEITATLNSVLSDIFERFPHLEVEIVDCVDMVVDKISLLEMRVEKMNSKNRPDSFLDLKDFDLFIDTVWILWSICRCCPNVIEMALTPRESDLLSTICRYYGIAMRLNNRDLVPSKVHLFYKHLVVDFIHSILMVSKNSALLLSLFNEFDDGSKAMVDTQLVVDLQCVTNIASSLEIPQDHSLVRAALSCDRTLISSSPEPQVTPDTQEAIEYVARSSLISQIRDLFPDLGEGFLDACLINYGDNSELVIAKLLEDDLAPELKALDRSLPRNPPSATARASETHPQTSHRSEVVPVKADIEMEYDRFERRNVYDHDEFDIFHNANIDESRVIFGKKEGGDPMKEEKQRNLDRIIAYSMYDDEYDDTFEALMNPAEALESREDQSADPIAPHFKLLLAAYVEDAASFNNSKDSRNSKARIRLREQTKLSDEQIEGWRSQFERNPNMKEFVRDFQLFNFNTNRERPVAESSPSRGRGSSRGRGRGGSRGNNRRRGRDKKLERAVKPS